MAKSMFDRVARPLRFNPYAWAKLLFLRDLGKTEVGGFGISALADPLLVTDVILVPQECTGATVKFKDEGVADFFDAQVDAGRQPAEFCRIWCHTHPGDSAHPSSVDEETLQRVFGTADWAMMFILACGGETYARARFNAGPGGEQLLPVQVDFSVPFLPADFDAWQDEYASCVTEPPRPVFSPMTQRPGRPMTQPRWLAQPKSQQQSNDGRRLAERLAIEAEAERAADIWRRAMAMAEGEVGQGVLYEQDVMLRAEELESEIWEQELDKEEEMLSLAEELEDEFDRQKLDETDAAIEKEAALREEQASWEEFMQIESLKAQETV